MKKLRRFLGLKVQWLAWRILPYEDQPKIMGWYFTFETYKGIVFNQDGRGCKLMYIDDREYEKAHSESLSKPPRIDWKKLANGGR